MESFDLHPSTVYLPYCDIRNVRKMNLEFEQSQAGHRTDHRHCGSQMTMVSEYCYVRKTTSPEIY